MNYERFIRNRLIKKQKPDFKQIDHQLKRARKDLKTAESNLSIDLTWAFTIAYHSTAGILRMTRSSESMSIKRLWIRISHLSHVAVPSPDGPLSTGTRKRLVGSGTGPFIFTPVFEAILLSSPHTSSNLP